MSFLNLYDRESSQAVDALIVDTLNLGNLDLIRKAAGRALVVLLEKWPRTKSIAVFCGAGKNGADGLVLALLAKKIGLDVNVYWIGSEGLIKRETRICYEDCIRNGLIVKRTNQFDGICDVVVDAIFGVGLNREVEGEFDEAIKIINDCKKKVLSMDIPSGVNSTSGAVFGRAVKADLTVCFLVLKQGLFTGAGKIAAGEPLLETLVSPETFIDGSAPTAYGVCYEDIRDRLIPRKKDVHKGDFGHLLILGGYPGYSGAALLCGSSAIRAGTGLVSIGTHPNHASVLACTRPELMCHAISRVSDIKSLLKKSTVVAVGPGLSQKPWGIRILEGLRETSLPCVYDADALNLLARKPDLKVNRVLTPHVKEAARLLDVGTTDIESDRFLASRQMVKKFGGTVLLKGPGTVIVHQDDVPVVLLDGNPGMASGGMGDVLTGIIGSFLAQGFPQGEATVLAGALHSHAADVASDKYGQRGLAANDLMDYIQLLVNP